MRYTWGSVDYGKLGHSLDVLDPELDLRSNAARSDINVSRIQKPKLADEFTKKGIKARRITCRYNNTYVIDFEGRVWALGNTEKGANGTGLSKEFLKHPQMLETLKNEEVVDVDCGNSFCLALTKKGDVFSWGFNNYGQLGNSPNRNEYTPNKIESFEKPISQITCGEYFASALDNEGSVYTWGRGNSGQLGHGNNADLTVPKKIQVADKFTKISAGDMHLLLQTEKGEAYVVGNGRDGQIGRGDKIESSVMFRTTPMKLNFLESNGVLVDDIQSGGSHCLASGLLV